MEWLLALLVLVWFTGQPATAADQHSDGTAATAGVRETPASSGVPAGYIARKVSELKALRDRKYMDPVEVDLEVSVTFVGPSWTTFFATDGIEPIMVSCTSAVSKLLEKRPLGTRLRVRGFSHYGHESMDMASFELLGDSSDDSLNPLLGRLDDNRLPANIFLSSSGRVEEVYHHQSMVALGTECTHEKCLIELYRPTATEEVLRYLDRSIEFTGVFSPAFHEGDPRLYKVRLMSLDQVATSTPVTHQKTLDQFESYLGEVVYTDHKSRFVLATDKDVIVFRSRFCEHLRAGSVVEAYASKPATQDSGEHICRAVFMKGEHELGEGQPVRMAELTENDLRPSRVILTAQVESVEKSGKDLLLGLKADGVRLTCLIPEYDRDLCLILDVNTRAQDVGRGDTVRVTGAVKRQDSDSKSVRGWNNRPKLSMYCSSSRDLAIVTRARHFTFAQLATLLGGAFSVLLVSFGGNWYLKRSVDTRTRQLTVLSRRLQATFESMHQGLLVCENDGTVIGANQRFVELFGFEPASGQMRGQVLDRIEALTSDQSGIRDLKEHAISDSKQSCMRILRLAEGTTTIEAYVNVVRDKAGRCTGQLWAFEDITKKLEFENEVLELKKIDAAGQLSAGVAHDFNNLLTVIRSNLFTASHLADSHENIRPFLNSADQAVERAVVLTQYLLDYSRRSKLQLSVTDLRRVLKHLEVILRSVLPKSVALQIELPEVALPVNLDESRFEQVLVNMCVNSRDAMPDQGGLIRLVAQRREGQTGQTKVVVSVIDNGHGMSQEVAARVFEPFFSTKAPGKGTGLGLSMAHGVLVQMGGTIRCDSQPGRGTTFELTLPMADENDLAPEASPTGSIDASKLDKPGGMRILLVDDEPLVRLAGQALLETMGHQVIAAANGVEALSMLELDDQFDAVLLDLNMPELSGQETFRRIRLRWPNLPVALCSGFTQDSLNWGDKEIDPPLFVPKPYTVMTLRNVLSELAKQSASI